jgi:hypothetical protein
MKSSVLIIFATLLATAILAPSVITLSCLDEKTAITIDFNDEENKEVKEKDFFLNSNFQSLKQVQGERISISSFHIESGYSTAITIFLPPPEHTL